MQLQFRFGPAKIAIEADSPPKNWSRDYRQPYYLPFEVNGDSAPDLAIRIRRDPPPAREAASLIAELVSHWQLFGGEGGYRLEILEQVRFQPKSVVLMNEGMSRADVYILSHLPDWYLGALMETFVQWWLTRWLACQKQGFILHGTAFTMEDQTFIFFGPSGAGKTTIARWCRDEGGARVLSDERIIVWQEGKRWLVSGTPWPGELHVALAATAGVTHLAALVKGEVNQWSSVSSEKFFPLLISEAFLPIWDKKGMEGLIKGIQKLMEEVLWREFSFKNDPGIVPYLKSLPHPQKIYA